MRTLYFLYQNNTLQFKFISKNKILCHSSLRLPKYSIDLLQLPKTGKMSYELPSSSYKLQTRP